MDQIQSLEERITYLEKHVSEQDAEMYQQSRRIDSLQAALEKLEVKLASFREGGDMPADEKPPHY